MRLAKQLGIVFLVSGLGLAGCVSMRQSLAQRATFELGCQVSESDVVEVVTGQFGVQACGCKALYLSYPTWTLNSVSGDQCKLGSPVPAASQAAAPAPQRQ